MVSKTQRRERSLHYSCWKAESCHSISGRGGRGTMKSTAVVVKRRETAVIASASCMTLGSKVIQAKNKKRLSLLSTNFPKLIRLPAATSRQQNGPRVSACALWPVNAELRRRFATLSLLHTHTHGTV